MAEVRPDEISAILRKQLSGFESETEIYDVGTVLQVGDGIARVYGLGQVMASELVEFPNELIGMVLNLEEDSVGCVLFGDSSLVKEGDTVKRTKRVASLPVGEEMLGRVVNPLFYNILIKRTTKPPIGSYYNNGTTFKFSFCKEWI